MNRISFYYWLTLHNIVILVDFPLGEGHDAGNADIDGVAVVFDGRDAAG